MDKQVIIINGTGGSGKDTFVEYCSEFAKVTNISSVDKVKEAAKILVGWNGEKDENAVTNVNRKKASKEKFVMHLHYINDCWDYRKYNRKRYLEHLVAITRDGLANGYKFGEILSMLKTKPRRLLVLLISPVGYLLYKRS